MDLVVIQGSPKERMARLALDRAQRGGHPTDNHPKSIIRFAAESR